MKKISIVELRTKFIAAFQEESDYQIEGNNPFKVNLEGKSFFIYLKNLSSAYFKNKDVTRVQLPYHEKFDKIIETDILFLILGYDIDEDIMVCWNPDKVKDRLNAKTNVSFYSRLSLQTDIQLGEIKEGYLKNKDKFIIFKRTDLSMVLNKMEDLFDLHDKKDKVKNESNSIVIIEDASLLREIALLLRENKVLKAVEVCSKHYGKTYPQMKFNDWFKLINKIYKDI